MNKTMKNYKEFVVTFIPFNAELISGPLWELDIAGINELDNSLVLFTIEDSAVTIENVEEIMRSLQKENLVETFSVTEELLENKNWNEEWEKKVRVIQITDKIVIKPSFKEYTPKENQVIIQIDPKMSFGTGEHATTRLVLEFCENYVSKNDMVLDVGCGTGVLAIGSVLLGAKKAIGIDNDEWCLLNGNENVALNKLEDKVEIRLCETKDVVEKDFDLILANINKHILIDIRNDLYNKMKAGGKLILSGLLNTDEEDILKHYSEMGLKLKEKKHQDEWIALIFTK
ncbi:MAG: 50S ribosomal protein L11 methyltransferase [Flavobacterium sp.]|nr:50S ribosomal protein L11 methyltransferase [Flavobacterium sp.]